LRVIVARDGGEARPVTVLGVIPWSEVASIQESSDRLVGATFDRYRLLRRIGEGAMGRVYEAEHVGLGKRVAIKVLKEELCENADAIARFRREAEAASRIGSSNIVEVLDLGMADGRAFIAMELLSGQSLAAALAEAKRFSLDRAINVIRQVLRGVGAAHAKGILHRDLKPENIFLVQHSTAELVKVLDFGISKLIDEGATRLTSTGALVGTPLYMAPEQIRAETVDRRTDLWACGVMLYEMLTGRPPFDGDNLIVLAKRIAETEPTKLKSIVGDAPPRLVATLERALAKRPEDRFATAEDFANAIPDPPPRAVAPAAPPPAAPRGRGIALAAAAGVVSLGVGLAVGAFVLHASPPPAPPPAAPPPPPPDTTGVLGISSTPEGAEAFVDDKPVGTTPLEALHVPAGHHRVTLRKLASLPVHRDEDIKAGERVRVDLSLPPVHDLRATVSATPKLDAAVTDKIAALVTGPTRNLLTGCWELYSAATGKPDLAVSFAYVGTGYTDDNGDPVTNFAIDWHEAAATESDLAVRTCAKTALDAAVRKLSLFAKAEITLTLAPP
jgi:eukaryotic-like serine/threonine-protein kinase